METTATNPDTKGESSGGPHGFDFLLGRWNVQNRRLARRLEGNTEWQEFPATYEMRFLLGGLCNIGPYEATLPGGQAVEALLLRCFNPQTNEWSVYWNDSVQCELQPPVVGKFKGNRIELFGDDVFKGAPIRVRCIYEKLSPDRVRWEQAFWDERADDWETNWIMDFTRASAEIPTAKSQSAGSAKQTSADSDGRHDFDFLSGRWDVLNRRLARRLEDNNEWQEFPASNKMQPLMSGLCNLDEYDAAFPGGKQVQGITLRCFNPQSRKWSIYWNDSVQCELQPPVIGEFRGNRGEFYGDDTFNGKRIRVRYVWLKAGPDSAQWEQAFSQDGENSWETNWVMKFRRFRRDP